MERLVGEESGQGGFCYASACVLRLALTAKACSPSSFICKRRSGLLFTKENSCRLQITPRTADGWPGLSGLAVLFPISKLWVPRPFDCAQGRLLRFSQGRARCCQYHELFMSSGLHRTYGSHHLHFITCSCYHRFPFLGSARARDRFVSILEQTRQRYRFVLVGHVVMPRACASADQRTGSGQSVDSDAGREAAHRTGALA